MRNAECEVRKVRNEDLIPNLAPHSALRTLNALLSPFRADGFEDGLRLRELAGGKFGINFLSIDRDFKGAAAGWHQRQRTDRLLEPQ